MQNQNLDEVRRNVGFKHYSKVQKDCLDVLKSVAYACQGPIYFTLKYSKTVILIYFSYFNILLIPKILFVETVIHFPRFFYE